MSGCHCPQTDQVVGNINQNQQQTNPVTMKRIIIERQIAVLHDVLGAARQQLNAIEMMLSTPDGY